MAKVHEIKPEKVAAAADICEKLKAAQSVTICSYSGLTVEQVTELRKLCRNGEVAYVVLKNRLVQRALNEVGITGLDDLLNGPNAFVFSMKDAVAGPRIINDYIEKNKLQSLQITGGIVDGAAADVATMTVLAKMPSREEMLATIVGCLQSPISSLVAVLDQIAEQKESA